MKLRRPSVRSKGEPTIALINIVFLMLIFFMVAGALAPPMDGDVSLVDTDSLDGRSPPDAAVIRADGTLSYRGRPISPAQAVTLTASGDGDRTVIRIVPDRDLPAETLMDLAAEIREAGADDIWLVTEKGIE